MTAGSFTGPIRINEVQVKAPARLSAPIWQALATTERIRDGRDIAIVRITNYDDTTVVISESNYTQLLHYVQNLEEELQDLRKGTR